MRNGSLFVIIYSLHTFHCWCKRKYANTTRVCFLKFLCAVDKAPFQLLNMSSNLDFLFSSICSIALLLTLSLELLSALFPFIPCIFLFTSSLAWSINCCTGESTFTVTFSSRPPLCEGPTGVINCYGLPDRDSSPICFPPRCA